MIAAPLTAFPEETAAAFLFDSDTRLAGNSYGDRFDTAFLQALQYVDSLKATRSRILRGDLLLDDIAYRPGRVTANVGVAKTGAQRIHSSGLEMRGDNPLFATLIGELCDSFSDQHHTLDLATLPEVLAKRSICCIVLPNIRGELLSGVDGHDECYLGMVVPDLGNPLHRHLFIKCLIRDAFIERGTVHLTLSDEGHPEAHFGGASVLAAGSIVHIPSEDFHRRSPALPGPVDLSPRGLVTEARLKSRAAPSVHERVASELSSKISSLGLVTDFVWDLRDLPNAPDEVVVQARRLTEYLLNLEHPKGGSKAKFLKQALGIDASDWRYLQAQLVDSLAAASFEDLRLDEYGIRFDATLSIRGRDGRVAAVKTGWIVRSGERATLVTAFPGDERKVPSAAPYEPNVLLPDLKGDDRWRALFEAACEAGTRAAEICVPTPMKIEGYPMIMEGQIGGAYVHFRDSRRGFARWLRINGYTSSHYRSGVCFYARTQSQSVDGAKAYVEAFVGVLRRNDTDGTVEIFVS